MGKTTKEIALYKQQNIEVLKKVLDDRLAYRTPEVAGLPDIAKEILEARREPSTYATYRREWKRFCNWVIEQKAFEYPITPHIAGAYLVWLHGKGYGRSTIRKAVTVLRLAHDEFDNPCEDRTVREILRGIMRHDIRPTRKARPLYLSELVAICDRLASIGDWKALRDRAMLCVGWMGALRSAEIVSLVWSDIAEVEAGIELSIRGSKMNKTPDPEIIGLPLLATSHEVICPVRALRAIRPVLHPKINYLINDEPVFLSRPAVRNENFISLSRASSKLVHRAVERGAKLAGLKQHYSSHCLRRGFATYAASQGITESAIMRHGRWKSSQIAQGYIERDKIWSANPIRELLGQT